MKRLLITSTDLMMIQFLVPHVLYLREQGYAVEVACSEVGGRLEEVKEKLGAEGVHQVRLVRSPASLTNLKGLNDLKKLINSNHYDIIWTNEPVMGIMTRLAAKTARKKGTKVVYMVHGFHFYVGAPKLNWMTWFPIEKYMSRHCDLLLTVNNEDYIKAQTMPYKQVKYVHGIGINTERLSANGTSNSIRKELNLSEDTFLIVAVGELNRNKNQSIIIQALSKINDENCHLILCGKGDELENLKSLVDELNLKERVHFLGYRKDVVDIVKQANIYVMASYREGLPVAALEAMYCGLPLVTSRCRGLNDIMTGQEQRFICDPNSSDEYANTILELMENPQLCRELSRYNSQQVLPYCINEVKKEVVEIISGIV